MCNFLWLKYVVRQLTTFVTEWTPKFLWADPNGTKQASHLSFEDVLNLFARSATRIRLFVEIEGKAGVSSRRNFYCHRVL